MKDATTAPKTSPTPARKTPKTSGAGPPPGREASQPNAAPAAPPTSRPTSMPIPTTDRGTPVLLLAAGPAEVVASLRDAGRASRNDATTWYRPPVLGGVAATRRGYLLPTHRSAVK